MESDEEMVVGEPDLAADRRAPASRSGGFPSLAGVWRGQVRIGDDFDDLPADLAESFSIEA